MKKKRAYVRRKPLVKEVVSEKKTTEVEQKKEPPSTAEKTDAHCVEKGCFELKAPGQTYVCAKHIRT